MCGIVCFYGQSDGLRHVLGALELLAYRAPDSSGVAVVDDQGEFAIRRVVGTSKQLQEKIAAQPLAELRSAAQPGAQVVVGHGRWAMVGAVSEENAHPITDYGRDRLVCENGSHNASLMLGAYDDQEEWWRQRLQRAGQPVAVSRRIHRSENTTEALAFEWEREALEMAEGKSQQPEDQAFLARVDEQGITDLEERALRLAVWRLREGNAHACAFYGRRQPDVLFITSHNKPITIAVRRHEDGQRELMVCSDANAALMLWTRAEVDEAARQIRDLQSAAKNGSLDSGEALSRTQAILDRFSVETFFLDKDLNQGQELFVRISNSPGSDQVTPEIAFSRYDGRPLAVTPQIVRLNPAIVGSRGFASFTESHIDEIPEIVDRIIGAYIRNGHIRLNSAWHDGRLFASGLNVDHLRDQYGPRLEKLRNLLLIGEGSSWRDAQAAAPLFRELLPDVTVRVFRPIEILNLGQQVYPERDLAIEISWSGTTDSLLKVDHWLADAGVARLAITGRPQSDLGRRCADGGGTLDVLSGVEVSVATVKGYQAILLTLDLLALQLAGIRQNGDELPIQALLLDELSTLIPGHLREIMGDKERRERIRDWARRCHLYNKIAVVGRSPVDVEAELKIEELAQVVARTFDFRDASLLSLIDRSAMMTDDRARTLIIINATTVVAQQETQPIINTLQQLGVTCLIHTTPGERLAAWQSLPNTEVFVSPSVSSALQPLIDAPFFFELAVALAYARGLSPEEIDRPRNLAKSVTTTGAERRVDIEARKTFHPPPLSEFGEGDVSPEDLPPSLFRPDPALEAALSVLSDPLPAEWDLDYPEQLDIVTDSEATENAALIAADAWKELLGIEVSVRREFMSPVDPKPSRGRMELRLIQAGAVPTFRDERTITLPAAISPLQLELFGAVYLVGLAIRLARNSGLQTTVWEAGLNRLLTLVSKTMADARLAEEIGQALASFVMAGYDKVQIIGGGQDYLAAASIARSLRQRGFMAEALYTDSAWHGPLATVGGPDADHDCLIVILATDPLFQAAAMVDTQVYRVREATVLLVVPALSNAQAGNQDLAAVQGVDAFAVFAVPAVPRPFSPLIGAAFGSLLSEQMARLWFERGG